MLRSERPPPGPDGGRGLGGTMVRKCRPGSGMGVRRWPAERGEAGPVPAEREEGGADQPHPGTRIGRCRCSLPGLTGFTA